MAPKDTRRILSDLRKLMKDRRYVQEPLAAYIVPSCDAHNSEYLADCDARREAVSGFTGSAGTAIITPSQALMWTDGRYHLQATKEMDENWTLMKDGLVETPSQAEWLCTSLVSGNVGVDPMLMSATAWASLADRLDGGGIQLVPVQDNLVDIAWDMDVASPQPGRPENTVLALDDVAWMLNLRGSDIAFNPVFFSYAAVTEKEVVLFINPAQVTSKVRDSLTTEDMGESVIIKDYSDIKDYIISTVANTTSKIWLSDTASHGLACLVPAKRRYLKVN